ncbi:MAG: xanthine dehydrogenase family protein molybdopterin-binding subunit [Proteobacteria bacterium]|nr:xanthine dehydrogenase family protein molybdopterin-binding subunit [Pseudomonadota bacterium]
MTIETQSNSAGPRVTRRGFLAGTGGLTFAIVLGANGAGLITPARAKSMAQEITAWVRIAPDDVITILTPAAEMGQGSMTSVPLILAEELDADWDKVVLEWAPADPKVYGYTRKRGGRVSQSMAIVGSRAVMMYYNQMRIAGAQARKVLLDAAASRWRVPVSELTTEPSQVVHGKSGRRMSYGEIASFARMPATLPKVGKGALKKKSEFRLIGKSVPRRDIPGKVNGTAQFSIDVHLPGMVYASTVHSPVQNGKPKSWNEAKIKAMPGVLGTVKLKQGVAIVADSFEQVLVARSALKVEWKGAKAKGFDSETVLEKDYARIAGDPKAKIKTLQKIGDDKAAFAQAARTYKAEFRSDLGYHAQMEPLNAVARFNAAGDRVEIWEGTQAPGRSRQMIAKALGFETSQVIHHQCYMGGGFGRRSRTDYTIEAALIAKEIKRPVKMIWTREEDIAYGMFRPQSLLRLEAALDASGKVTGWRHSVTGDGKRLLQSGIKNFYYQVPNKNIERRGASHGIRLKHWRAVGHVFNVYAIEAFIDEMAAAEGMDSLDFRLQRMSPSKKAQTVLETVAKMSDWRAKRPEGRAVGLSMSERSGSLGAGVVEISLDGKSGKIRVHKTWLAIDGGTIVQPDSARRNLESGIIYGLSSVLKERATMKDGIVEQSNFHDYEVLRITDAPEELHVEFVDKDTKPTGIGEIGNPWVAAAVANAFHALTGKRLHHMPFTPERVKAVLKA